MAFKYQIRRSNYLTDIVLLGGREVKYVISKINLFCYLFSKTLQSITFVIISFSWKRSTMVLLLPIFVKCCRIATFRFTSDASSSKVFISFLAISNISAGRSSYLLHQFPTIQQIIILESGSLSSNLTNSSHRNEMSFLERKWIFQGANTTIVHRIYMDQRGNTRSMIFFSARSKSSLSYFFIFYNLSITSFLITQILLSSIIVYISSALFFLLICYLFFFILAIINIKSSIKIKGFYHQQEIRQQIQKEVYQGLRIILKQRVKSNRKSLHHFLVLLGQGIEMHPLHVPEVISLSLASTWILEGNPRERLSVSLALDKSDEWISVKESMCLQNPLNNLLDYSRAPQCTSRGHQRQVRQRGGQLGLRGHPLHPPLRPPPLLRQGRHLHPHEHQEGHLHPRPRALPQVQQRGQGPHRQAAGEGPQQALHRPQRLRAPLGQAGNLQEHRGPQPPRGGLPRAQEARDHERVPLSMQPQEDHPDVPGSADLREGDRGPAEDLREAGRQRQQHDLEGGDDDRARVPEEGGQRQPQRQRHRADLHRDGLRQQRTGGLHRVHRQLPRRHHHQERQVPAQGVREAGRGQGRQAQQARHREPHALRHRLPRQGRRPEDDRRRRQDRLRRVPRAAQGEDQDLLQGDVVIPSLSVQLLYQPQQRIKSLRNRAG